jgi:cytochrome c biogenesis protein CcmG, thiol:disulfide interchange protein DsbE
MRKSLLIFIFIIILMALIWVFHGMYVCVHHDNAERAVSSIINKPEPHFTLPSAVSGGPAFTSNQFTGHVSLLNIFNRNCPYCQAEMPLLTRIHRQYGIALYGIDSGDTQADAQHNLYNFGNPYDAVGLDETGQIGVRWALDTTPELYVIDPQGIIRGVYLGQVTRRVWRTQLHPLIKQLQAEN